MIFTEKEAGHSKGLPEASESYWIASTPKTNYPKLVKDINVDVAIIGGGMVGITTAYLLKREGVKVAVIEADRILQGTTGHTTAKVTSQHNLIYNEIKNKLGEEMARQYAEANESAIDFIANLISEKNIDCDFVRQSSYIYTHEDKYVKQIQDEAESARHLGIKAVYLEEIPLPFKVKAAVRFDGQAQFHPRKYLLALAQEIPGDGCQIFEQTRVTAVEEDTFCTISTNTGSKVFASKVIIASHYPCINMPGLYFARLFPERSYAIGVTIEENYPGGMYITAEDPGRSLRSQKFNGGELIIIGGEHHKTGHGENTMNHYFNLRKFALETYTVKDILYRWSTQDYTSADKVPYVGRYTADRPNLYVASGFRKWGMTNSTASAMILRDLIVKGESPWQDVYNPSRFTPAASAKKVIVENADVAGQFVSGKIEPLPNDTDIKNGEAKVIEVDGKRTGAYRDQKGVLHLVDTTCTHLGCEIHWNEAEKTWDCPCHGSRFTYDGDIVDGPALKPLKTGKNITGE